MTSTSSVFSERCTSTLSMTTWKNSGETSANNCRKNDASSTSPSRRRYLWIAPRNQVMSKRRPMSDKPARRVIRINPPSQMSSSSARDISAGRESCGDCTSTSSSLALATTMNRPSRRLAIAGNGVLASRDHLVRHARAFNPKSLAHRRISDAPILLVPSRWRICSRSAATPWKCSNVTRASSPEVACRCCWSPWLICILQGDAAFRRAAASPATAAGSHADQPSASRRDLHRPRRSSMP